MKRKIKYDFSFKKSVVSEVIDAGLSTMVASRLHGLNESMVRRWVSFYKEHGPEGLKPINNQYNPNFKVKVILEMRKNGLSFNHTCVRFKIPSVGCLMKWVKIYDQEGPEGLNNKHRRRARSMPRKPKKPMTREEQLLDELADLKAENAYLKKLHALVQSEKEKEEKRRSSRN